MPFWEKALDPGLPRSYPGAILCSRSSLRHSNPRPGDTPGSLPQPPPHPPHPGLVTTPNVTLYRGAACRVARRFFAFGRPNSLPPNGTVTAILAHRDDEFESIFWKIDCLRKKVDSVELIFRGRFKVLSDFSSQNWKKSKYPTCMCRTRPRFCEAWVSFQVQLQKWLCSWHRNWGFTYSKIDFKKIDFFRSWSSSFDLKSCLY